MAALVHFFFHLQNNIKLYHWNTTSFARHKATDELHESILALSDQFMEVYMGKYGRPTQIPKIQATVPIAAYTEETANLLLDAAVKFLTQEMSKYIKKEDTDLWNIRDELLGKINQTKYLFTLH